MARRALCRKWELQISLLKYECRMGWVRVFGLELTWNHDVCSTPAKSPPGGFWGAEWRTMTSTNTCWACPPWTECFLQVSIPLTLTTTQWGWITSSYHFTGEETGTRRWSSCMAGWAEELRFRPCSQSPCRGLFSITPPHCHISYLALGVSNWGEVSFQKATPLRAHGLCGRITCQSCLAESLNCGGWASVEQE
jgi:hypothetical protein